jgi:hypothetical protein
MKLDSKKLRLILLGLMAVSVLLFIAIIFIGTSALSSKSQQMVALKVKSQTADLQLSNLEQSKKDVEKYSYFKQVAKTVIPSDKNQAQTVLDIFQIADAAGISIQTITFPSGTLGATAAVAAQDATSASTQTAITQAKPVLGIPGLYSLELTITPQSNKDAPPDKAVTYSKMLDFLSRIEKDRRTAQISQIDIQPAGGNQGLSFNLSVNTFIKP